MVGGKNEDKRVEQSPAVKGGHMGDKIKFERGYYILVFCSGERRLTYWESLRHFSHKKNLCKKGLFKMEGLV